MRKILCLVLALTMVFALCACGAGSGGAKAEKKGGEAPASGAKYVFLDEDLGVETYAIGFRKGDEELAETVSSAVKALVLNGTFDAIAENYPEISSFLCLKAEDIDPAEAAEEGSGDSSFTFKHGFDKAYPPYSYMQDDGTMGGFDIDLCQAVCKYLGWGYEPVPINWETKHLELQSGSCDCIWSGFTKEGRENDYTWGITYSNNTQGILVAADSGIQTLADLSGKIVGVQIDTSAAEMLEGDQAELAATFGELKTYEDYQVAFTDLKAGAIDAIAIDMTAGSFLIAGETETPAPSADAEYVFLDEDLGVETYAIGFRKGDEELAETVSSAVKALVLNGTFDAIAENYPEISSFLCLKAEDINPAEAAEEGSGDSSFTFKHGFDKAYPPYSYMQDDGTMGGFDIDLCQAVCKYLGWGYEPVPINWETKHLELQSGSCDCIWSGFTKEGRENDYAWGITYSNNTQGILVAADSGIQTLADLSGKIVGVQIDTSAAEMLEGDQAELAATFGELKTYEDYQVAFTDLKAGAIDAVAIDMTAGSFLIAGEG